jgi:predicted nucleic acid-binding protein
MILLDNTVLSNFALVDELTLLKQFCVDSAASTLYVLDEFEQGVEAGLFKKVNFSWIVKLDFDNGTERNIFNFLHKRFGAGEASCLAIGIHRRYDFLSDDMMARKLALREGLRVSGSIGILIELIHQKVITLKKGNNILKHFIKWGYFSPVEKLDEYI